MPIATASTGFSARRAWMRMRLLMSLSIPPSILPPPVIIRPLCSISATSSGGVRSSTDWRARMMCSTSIARGSSSSWLVMVMRWGRPVTRLRPFTSYSLALASSGQTVAISRLMRSAVLSPIRTL